MNEAFELTAGELADRAIAFDGSRLRIRPTRRARLMGFGAFTAVGVAAAFAVVLRFQESGWFGPVFFAVGGASYAIVGVQTLRAELVATKGGLVIRNMWRTYRLVGPQVQGLAVEGRESGHLWGWGVDSRWFWRPTVVGVVVTTSGDRILPEALRSRNMGGTNATATKLAALGRWRIAFWAGTDRHATSGEG